MTDPDETKGAPDTPTDTRADPGLQAGRVLADRYRLERPIGRGGMGAVWQAEQLALGRRVAVKVIRGGIDDSETARARFVREARSAAGLDSPHVVQIFDYGVDDGVPYIAMELLTGESLADRLDRERRLSPPETLAILSQIGKALSRAHGADIVHRDLKPDNVFLCEDPDDPESPPTVKVLDFGIAKQRRAEALGADTRSGAMLGTPYYMSPEHARRPRDADARSDLWSLGVIAYECLVGARPFDADSLPALSVQILVDDIPVPSEHAEVPAGFDGWFARATARDPDERFQSAREMTRALATALGQPEMSTLSVSVDLPGSESSPGRGLGWFAVMGLVALGVGAFVLTRDRDPKPAASPGVTVPAAAPERDRGGTEAEDEAETESESVTEPGTGSVSEPATGSVSEPAIESVTKAEPRPRKRPRSVPAETTGGSKVDDLEF